MSGSRNRRAYVNAALIEGAVSVTWEAGRKHDKFKIVLLDGTTVHDTISHSKHDPYKIRGWARQLINRAKAQAKADDAARIKLINWRKTVQ